MLANLEQRIVFVQKAEDKQSQTHGDPGAEKSLGWDEMRRHQTAAPFSLRNTK